MADFEKRITDCVDTAVKELAKLATRDIVDDLVAKDDGELESPAEVIFWIGWQAVNVIYRGMDCGQMWLIPQHRIIANGASYRLDFAVREEGKDEASPIAVEIDGHEFHERTKEQVELRNRRDRDLQIAGWKVFHFAGSEIHRDPFRCALDVRLYALHGKSLAVKEGELH